jgi:hypothetical protein
VSAAAVGRCALVWLGSAGSSDITQRVMADRMLHVACLLAGLLLSSQSIYNLKNVSVFYISVNSINENHNLFISVPVCGYHYCHLEGGRLLLLLLLWLLCGCGCGGSVWLGARMDLRFGLSQWRV